MSLLGKMKKTGPSHEEKVNLAYKCYRAEFVDTVFPKGIHQAENIIISLAKIYGKNLDVLDAKGYYDILSTYSDVLIRKAITQSLDENIMLSLQVNHENLVPDKDTARRALAYVSINMNNNDFALNDDVDMSALDLFVESLLQVESVAQENESIQNEGTDDPEYGHVPGKPIYAQGVNGSYRYLEELKSEQGEKLSWERLGATSAPGINGIIDIYQSFLPSGEKYDRLYVNMYGTANSKSIPRGFSK